MPMRFDQRRRSLAWAVASLIVSVAVASAQTASSPDTTATPRSAPRSGVATDSVSIPASVRPSTGAPSAMPALPAPPARRDTIINETPELFLSWHRPFGMPGAAQNIEVAPSDTARRDTLWLSFDPGRDGPRFYSMFARLYFHPRMGDTLGNYWHWEGGSWNQGNLRMEFDPDGTFPCLQPFVHHGVAVPKYTFNPGLGRLDMIFAVRLQDAAPVAAGTRYCFARVIFHHKGAMLPGSGQPMCVEWAEGRVSFDGPDIVSSRGAHRWVTMNAASGDPCGDYKRTKAPAIWRPGAGVNARPAPDR